MFDVFREILQQPFFYFMGLIATVGLGIILDMRLNAIVSVSRNDPPAGMSPQNWATLLEWPETYGGAVHWLGLLERVLFYTAASLSLASFIVGWLVFKLICYWAVWHSFLRVDGHTAEMSATEAMVMQSRRASAMATACTFGTLGNLLVAALGFFVFILFMRALPHLR